MPNHIDPLNKDNLYRRNREILKKSTDLHFCYFDGQPIDMTLKFPHPMSWSCQHIVPRSRGGTSEMENLAAAHKRCQDREGNALAGTVGTEGDRVRTPVRRSHVW